MPPVFGSPARPAAPVVHAESVSWRSPTGQVVLAQVTLALAREKAGLVGCNGCGKSTLAQILAGTLAPSSGAVCRTGNIAMLPQDFTPLAGCSVAQGLGIDQKRHALARLTAGRGQAGDLAILDDDWSLEERVATMFQRLGLGHVELDREMGTLSGGETTRIALAALLLMSPDLVILDEPTNNLDLASREALYDAVGDWPGGLLVVSHDRQLLSLMGRIVELSPQGLRSYGGNFELYATQRDAEASAAERNLQHAAKELRKTRREAQAARERQDRRNSRGKKSRDKMGLGKMALDARRQSGERTAARQADVFQMRLNEGCHAVASAQARIDDRKKLDISLSPVELPAGKMVLEMADVSFRYEAAERPIIENFNLRIAGPQRLALIGSNGSGKSTLLGLIRGTLRPTAGCVRLGVGRISCLDQKADLLDPQRSVLENFRAWNPELPETVCRHTLARFLFRSDAALQLSGTLSGGERLRAALACVLTGVNPPELLLLDEPTNHLDLESLANLEQALSLYTGALLVVSHDRTFLTRIGIDRNVELSIRPLGRAVPHAPIATRSRGPAGAVADFQNEIVGSIPC